MGDDELAAVTVGARAPLNARIHLEDPSDDWPQAYEALASSISEALGSEARTLEHVGSTSVPQLPAKPVIDMVLVVRDASDEGLYVPWLAAIGYELRIREPDWYEHRMLRAMAREVAHLPSGAGVDLGVHLHVFSEGCEEVDRMLLFRNWLCRNPGDRELYARTKKELAARTWKHMQNYADAKGAVVREILARARDAED